MLQFLNTSSPGETVHLTVRQLPEMGATKRYTIERSGKPQNMLVCALLQLQQQQKQESRAAAKATKVPLIFNTISNCVSVNNSKQRRSQPASQQQQQQ